MQLELISGLIEPIVELKSRLNNGTSFQYHRCSSSKSFRQLLSNGPSYPSTTRLFKMYDTEKLRTETSPTAKILPFLNYIRCSEVYSSNRVPVHTKLISCPLIANRYTPEL
ncbi:hypothetical protein RF11_04337 [Thelohanellus kitauei]|uniref:Uncharacterized protein n=1 Tax=Thelohanellus kitauei TaxID=669202 RepID=A0A0C2ML07_THEKT|nr:hypothetical protein RF11_04337 [Thelohanellus kitauei]